jgi:hypothetical protein
LLQGRKFGPEQRLIPARVQRERRRCLKSFG